VFFKKRAVLEEEFGRGMQKLAKNTADVYAMNDGKAGSVSSFLFSIFPCLDLVTSVLAALSSTHGRQR
jgi:hypothetical protein